MRSLITLALFGALITSCSGKKKTGVDERTGLTDTEYEKMISINQALLNLDEAVTFGRRASPSNEKVDNMAKSLKDGNCVHDGALTPLEKYESNWTAIHTVNGGACPIDYQTKWDYTSNSLDRRWKINRSFTVGNEAFKTDSGLQSYRIYEGAISVSRTSSNGANQEVDVDISYNNFQMPGHGLVMANVRGMRLPFSGKKGTGTITFSIKTRTDLAVKVDMQFNGTRPLRYRVNGTNVDASVIDELFSAFKITEIKARIDKMLY